MSTPSLSRHSHTICAPVRCILKLLSVARSVDGLLCQDCSSIGRGYKASVTAQPAAGRARNEGRQRGQAGFDLRFCQADIQRARLEVKVDDVTWLKGGD